MPKEIERKFLVDIKKVQIFLQNPSALTQTYLASSENVEKRVRMIIKSASSSPEYVKTTKKPVSDDGLVREEIEESISEAEYKEALKQSAPNMHTIKKLRYKIPIEKYTFELDIYLDNLEGLALGEIEFPNSEEAKAFNHKKYDWIIEDVTSDKRLKNAYLAKYGIPAEEKRNYGMNR